MADSTYTLLVVEDSPDNRELYRHCLLTDDSCAYSLLEAASVEAGLELCQAQSIDAVLLDYLLPDGNGLEFLEALAVQSNGSIPPVVMMTGYGNERIAVQAMKLGAHDYLAKHDFRPELLQLTIRNTIENARLRLQLRQSEEQIIAERIHAEKERDRFFDLSIDLLAVGNLAGYFIRLNTACEELLGFSKAELMAEPFLDFVHPDDLEATTAATKGLNAGNKVVNFENRYRCKDGSYRWLSWGAMPYTERHLWYAVGHDITAQQAALQERNQAQAHLEEQNKELDSFVHVVSHDLKAPLRAIANLSEWIEEDFQGTLSVHSQQQMALLRSRVDRMAATIDGLLDYARIGRTDAQIDLVVVAELLAEVIDSLAPPPTFTITIAPNLPTLSTKRLLLFQVFTNLIGNAIKHHDRVDGSISISSRESGSFYEFIVTDDGLGIAPENHDKIFAIFQAINPQSRSDSTGIGLSIVRKIIETEGGTIWLKSQLSQGTTFYFTWPK
jgi:PAS domain S-box-containing protein